MQVVERALALLKVVCAADSSSSLSDVSAYAGLPLSTTHRLLKVLLQAGFVAQDPISQRYMPGGEILRIAAGGAKYFAVAELAGPRLRQLAQEFNETAFITQLIGQQAVCVALAESSRPLRISVGIGYQMPLHAAASARALLADLPGSESRALLSGSELTTFTPDTPSSEEEVMLHLEEIRNRGYDLCANEFDRNVWAAAYPIKSAAKRVIASITIAAPADRVAAESTQELLIAGVGRAASDIEALLQERQDAVVGAASS